MTDRFKEALNEWKSMPFAPTNKQVATWVDEHQSVLQEALTLATESEQLRKELKLQDEALRKENEELKAKLDKAKNIVDDFGRPYNEKSE